MASRKPRPPDLFVIVWPDTKIPRNSHHETSELAAKLVNFQRGYHLPLGEIVRYIPAPPKKRKKVTRARKP